MKKRVKIFSIILIVMMVLCTAITFVNAQEVLPNVNDYIPGNEDVPTNFTNMVGIIANTIQVIGIVASVIVLVMLGVKYMVGSVEERAEYKKSMIPYLIGTIMIVAIGTIVRTINSLVSQALEK